MLKSKRNLVLKVTDPWDQSKKQIRPPPQKKQNRCCVLQLCIATLQLFCNMNERREKDVKKEQ